MEEHLHAFSGVVLARAGACHAHKVVVGAQAGVGGHLAPKDRANDRQGCRQRQNRLRLLGGLQDPLRDLLHDAAGLEQVRRVVGDVVDQLVGGLSHGRLGGFCRGLLWLRLGPLALLLLGDGRVEVDRHVWLVLGWVAVHACDLGSLIEGSLDVAVVLEHAQQVKRVVGVAVRDRV